MEELILATLLGWILTKTLDKKATAQTNSAGGLIPQSGTSYSQKLGKVIHSWPSKAPANPAEFAQLFTTDENNIYPGALCSHPDKYVLRDLILNLYAQIRTLVNDINQAKQGSAYIQGDTRLVDALMEDLNDEVAKLNQSYQELKANCLSVPATGAPVSTIAPQKTFV